MMQKTEWLIIDSPGNPYCMRDTEYANLRIYKTKTGFHAVVHAGSYECIKLNSDGKWESRYIYHGMAETKDGTSGYNGYSGLSSTPVVIEKEIRSIKEMKSFLDEYVNNLDPIKLKERADDYNKRCPPWIKDHMRHF